MGHRSQGAASQVRWDRDTAVAVAATLQALATPSRLMILAVLQSGPLSVGELTEVVGMEQSAVSHQLRLLREAGLVTAERRGRQVHYALFDDHVALMIDQALDHAEHLRLAAEQRHAEAAAEGA
ncbi:MAG TPA: metalloregulator ArsR/SmtB family transcription factor [Nocardioidaceae bacterium]|nr:metalloregulator ArsR/SmtB family transcription factor [Nocardioidaceae bacterium]